jgi:hypothetical protein
MARATPRVVLHRAHLEHIGQRRVASGCAPRFQAAAGRMRPRPGSRSQQGRDRPKPTAPKDLGFANRRARPRLVVRSPAGRAVSRPTAARQARERRKRKPSARHPDSPLDRTGALTPGCCLRRERRSARPVARAQLPDCCSAGASRQSGGLDDVVAARSDQRSRRRGEGLRFRRLTC